MRCLALALPLRRRGFVVRFVSSEASDVERLSPAISNGFEVVHIRGGPRSPLPSSDATATLEQARAISARLILVDHYEADAEYMRTVGAGRAAVGAIDDVADRDLSSARWILNQNPGPWESAYPAVRGQVRLFGPSYALLRPEFVKHRGHRGNPPSKERVLVTFGGGDQASMLAATLEALGGVARRLEIRCLTPTPLDGGPWGPHSVSFVRTTDAQEVASLMGWADLSLNAAGSTSWELCCLGVPMIVGFLAENQRAIAERLDSWGCAVSLGAWSDGLTALAGVVERVLDDPECRARMSERGRALVDGEGADRAAASLESLARGAA